MKNNFKKHLKLNIACVCAVDAVSPPIPLCLTVIIRPPSTIDQRQPQQTVGDQEEEASAHVNTPVPSLTIDVKNDVDVPLFERDSTASSRVTVMAVAVLDLNHGSRCFFCSNAHSLSKYTHACLSLC